MIGKVLISISILTGLLWPVTVWLSPRIKKSLHDDAKLQYQEFLEQHHEGES